VPLLHNLLKTFSETQPDENANEPFIPDCQRLDRFTSFCFDENREDAAGGEIKIFEWILNSAELSANRRVHRFQTIPEFGTVIEDPVQQTIARGTLRHLQLQRRRSLQAF
jgi:hypothetical protein